MEIIIGTYEQFLIGYQLKCEDSKYTLSQSFTTRAHSASICGISCSSKFVASGSGDEVIRIFNMQKRSEFGTLMQHSGTVTQLEFFKDTHLFTSSEDSTICVWDTKNWSCEKTLRGHKDAVLSLSVHPSGKLMLSVSKDKTLRTWNLIKGRCAYVTNLKAIAHIVIWSPGCTFFAVAIDKRVDIYDITVGAVVHSIDFCKHVNSIVFISNDVILIGGDCNDILVYDIKMKCTLNKFCAHNNRLKAIECIRDFHDIKQNKIWVATVSSDGFIKLWEFDLLKLNSDPSMITSIDTTCRVTCLAIWMSDDSEDQKCNQRSAANEEVSKIANKKRKIKSIENNSNKKICDKQKSAD